MRSATNSRGRILSCDENTSSMAVVRTRKPVEPFLCPSFRRGLADDGPLVPRLRSHVIRQGDIFPSVPREPPTAMFIQCSLRPENVSGFRATGKGCNLPAVRAPREHNSAPALSAVRPRGPRAFTQGSPALLRAEQFLPGATAPHAGRPFRHDVRSGTRGLVADLDQDPAPLAGPGQREAPG